MNNDLISRPALADRIKQIPEDVCDGFQHVKFIEDCIQDAPAVDVEPVRHGKWVNMCECSVCGRAYGPRNAVHIQHYHYCPKCGAKMDGRTDDENHHL